MAGGRSGGGREGPPSVDGCSFWNRSALCFVPSFVKRLFVLLLVAATARANEISYRSLQSGWRSAATPLTDHGLHGEGQIIAVLDTGVDYDNCFFAEPDGSRPPVNLGSPTGGLEWQNVDLNRRKIVAYDFLWSCAQYPGATGCESTRMSPGSRN